MDPSLRFARQKMSRMGFILNLSQLVLIGIDMKIDIKQYVRNLMEKEKTLHVCGCA